MTSKIRNLSLEKQLFLSFLSLSVLLLLLSLSITLSFDLSRQRREIEKNIGNMAAYIASLDQVSTMLENGYPDPSTIKALDSLSENFSDINVIVICNTEGLRFYHTDRHKSGETYVAGDEDAILAGSPPYITTGYGTRGTQLRAFHAIVNKNGTITGFVMTSVFTAYLSRQALGLVPMYVLVLFIMLAISLFLTRGIIWLLRDSLLGHKPQELLKLYLNQATVLNAMDEGLIATDRNGLIVFANQRARALFPQDEPLTGKRLSALFSDSTAANVLADGIPTVNKSCLLNHRQLLCSELPIGDGSRIQGVLTILNDRTEIELLSDELSGARSMLDTLRAFNHEFLNKLHIILGYLQTGRTEDAITFITNSSLVSSDALRKTASDIRVPRLCALIIGKMMHAAELGITLTTAPNSRCYEKELFLPINVCVTVIGNLLENAIEELSVVGKETKEITLGIYCQPSCILITCEDTGRGVPDDLLPHILEQGISSKGEGRGMGLFLIKELTKEYGGDISIDTEPGEGTCISVVFPRKD